MFSVLETTSKDLSFIRSLSLTLVLDKNSFNEAVSFLDSQNIVGYDIETTGLSIIYDTIVGFSFGTDKRGFYVPIGHRMEENCPEELWHGLLEKLKEKKLVAHNAKFDHKFSFNQLGFDFEYSHDTMIMLALIDSDRIESKGKLQLKALAKEIFNVDMLELQEDLGTHDFSLVPIQDALFYAATDSCMAFKLLMKFLPDIDRLGLKQIYKLELDNIKNVASIEARGIKVDLEFIKNNESKLALIVTDMKRDIEKEGNFTYDINSPAQLSTFLYEFLKIPKWKESTSTDVKILAILADKHSIIEKLIEYSELRKLHDSFFTKVEHSIAEDGRIHADFNQMGARSGRFSSSGGVGRNGQELKINMQQMPKSKAFPIRKAFTTEDDFYWLHVDYSQLEYRVMASLSEEDSLLEAYFKGVDFHSQTASIFLNIPLEKVTPDDRSNGKTLNFAVSYGMTKYGLAAKLNISVQKAEALLEAYFFKLPKLKALIRRIKEETLKVKYVRTYFGRLRWFNNLPTDEEDLKYHLRKAFNTYIQGTAADIAKIGMRNAFRVIASYPEGQINCVSTIHDELNFEVHKSIPPAEIIFKLKEAMELKFEKSKIRWTPFVVDASIGLSFGELKDVSVAQLQAAPTALFDFFMSSAPKEVFQPREKDVIIKPSIVIEGDFSKKKLSQMKEVFSKNRGLFSIYMKDKASGKSILLESSIKLNPTPFVKNILISLGFKIDLHVEESNETVSIDKLLQ